MGALVVFVSLVGLMSPSNSYLCGVPSVRVPCPALPRNFAGCFSKILAFGNSLEDTGNLATLLPPAAPPEPYGETWPGFPFGRYSDGHLFVDYYAEAFKVPYTKPYQACKCGTNFATAGATALDSSFFLERNITTVYPVSISDEIQWYMEYRENCCPVADPCALYLIDGGGDDLVFTALAGYSPAQIIGSLVDLVVKAFVGEVQALIDSGAKNILVENIPQTSCTPLFKTVFASNDTIVNGCLVNYGQIVETFNRRLMVALSLYLRVPRGTKVAIEDRYAQFFEVWNNPYKYGIVDRERACCGGGGPYNFNPSARCGAPGSTVCPDPLRAIFWDEIHFTDRFDCIAVGQFLRGKFIIPVHGSFPEDMCCYH